MKKVLRYSAAVLVALAVLGIGGMYIATDIRRATPAPDALAAINSGKDVAVSNDKWLVFRPTGGEIRAGVIFYPGANCDIRGYAPVLRRIAAAGYLVADVPMPFDFAIFAPDRGLEAQADFPEIRRWIIVGHSMGGAMAAQFAHANPGAVQGVILWDSYPPAYADLSAGRLPVWNIHRARAGGQPPAKFIAQKHLFPAASRWVPIVGGNHMQFGSFIGGAYQEEWSATISGDEQHEQVIRATLRALAEMTGGPTQQESSSGAG